MLQQRLTDGNIKYWTSSIPQKFKKVMKKEMIGFSYGLKQMSTDISLTFPIPETSDRQNIDFWFEKAFEITINNKHSLLFNPKNLIESELLETTLRIMYLANTLLQTMRVPSFEIGKVLSLRIDSEIKKSWTVVLLIPFINNTNQLIYKLAYQTSAKIVMSLLSKKYNQENYDEIFNQLRIMFSQKFDKNRFGGESTIHVLKSAWLENIDFRHLGNGTYLLGLGANSVLINRGATKSDSAIGAKLSGDKWLTAKYLKDAGLPGPTHFRVSSLDASQEIADKLGWPIVVKPLDRDRGEGVTVNIKNINQLNDAIQTALKLSNTVLIEKQVVGVCHRILVVNGKVLIVAKRLPKSVKGDGENTVSQLIEIANNNENVKPPWSRLKPFPLDKVALENLELHGLYPYSIPTKDEFVPLRPIQTSEWGGVVEHFTNSIHPANSDIAIRAATLFGLSIAGIDIISSDITKPWFENGAIINEVNFSPLLSGTDTGNLISNIFDEIIPNNGKIPVEIFIGDEIALNNAKKIHLNFINNESKYWLTTDKLTLGNDGHEIHYATNSLFSRCSAILLDQRVEGLLVVIQNDELLRTGLPFKDIYHVHDTIDIEANVSISVDNKSVTDWKKKMKFLVSQYLIEI